VAYRADIEIAVRGTQELQRLQNEISATSKLVSGLNNFIENFGNTNVVRNINNLKKVVSEAATVFNEVALNTDEAVIAAKKYIDATADLNAGLRERAQLLKKVAEEERKARLARSGITETTQFAGPIGPGPASPIGSLVGQKSPVEERIRRTIDARRDELALQEALLRLEEKSAAAANRELQARGEIARLTAQGVNAATFRAAQTATPLALPAFQERGLQLLDDSVRLNASNLRIEAALNGERQRGVRFLEKQTAEEERQVRLGILGSRTNQLPGRGRASGNVPAGGFPVSGPLESAGFRKTQTQVGKFGENLALGAGFPLLFGGGAGSVAGSILGSFVGSGFGGQILGGALGQVLDQAVQSAAKLGTALQTLDLSALEESGIRVNANLETQVQLLRQAGDAASAQQLIQDQIFRTTGAIPGTVEGISDAVNLLNTSWAEFTAAASVALGIIGAPFAAALAAIIETVTLITKAFNLVLSGIGAAIRAVGEWVVSLVAGQEALDTINAQLKENNAELEKARAEYAPILAELNAQVLLNREILDLEKKKSAASNAAAKERNAQLSLEQKLVKTNAEFDDQIREVRSKINSANQQSIEQEVRLLEIRRNQTIESQKLESSLEIQAIRNAERLRLQREAERAAKEAARAAEEARRKELQQLQNILSLRGQLIQATLEAADIDVEIARFTQGEAAGIAEELNQLQARLDLQVRGLQLQLQQNLLAEDLTNEQKTLLESVYNEQVRNLTAQLNLRQQILKAAAAELKFQQFSGTQGAVRQAVQPFNDLTQQREQEIQFNKTFLRLVTEGILPAEAERIANFERLSTERLRAIDQDIEYTKVLLTQAEAYGVGAAEVNKLRTELERLQAARGAVATIAAAGPGEGPSNRERLQNEIGTLQGQLNQLVDPVNQLVTGAQAIGDAFAQSFRDIISGTVPVQQALSNFFSQVASSFLDNAAQIIAAQLQIFLLQQLLGFIGGGVASVGSPASGAKSIGKAASVFAEGGFVTGPTKAIIGEGGSDEYVIPANKMAGAMQRYNAGVRGEAVLKGASSTEQSGGFALINQPTQINISGGVMQFNDTNYIRQDQVPAIVDQASRAGEARALRKLQQSPSARRKIGM
jgi:hypothetical protein